MSFVVMIGIPVYRGSLYIGAQLSSNVYIMKDVYGWEVAAKAIDCGKERLSRKKKKKTGSSKNITNNFIIQDEGIDHRYLWGNAAE